MRSTTLLLLTAICLAAHASAVAKEPTADDLIKLAPVLDSSDPKFRSLDISGYSKESGVILKFRAIYRTPGQHAFLLSGGIDDVPVCLTADRKMMMYDPVSPAILFAPRSGVHSSLRYLEKERKVKFDFGFSGSPEGEKAECENLRFDLRSLLEAPAKSREVVKTGEMTYRLILTSKHEEGGTMVASFDLARAHPCISIETFSEGQHEPNFGLDRIIVNGVVSDDDLSFPARDRLAETLKVKDWPGDRMLKAFGGMATFMRAMEARIGVESPEARKSIRFAKLQGIRWNKVKANDAKYSAALKQLIPSAQAKPATTLAPASRPRESTSQSSPPAEWLTGLERLTGLGGALPK